MSTALTRHRICKVCKKTEGRNCVFPTDRVRGKKMCAALTCSTCVSARASAGGKRRWSNASTTGKLVAAKQALAMVHSRQSGIPRSVAKTLRAALAAIRENVGDSFHSAGFDSLGKAFVRRVEVDIIDLGTLS